jgi:hypothetical protein
MCHPEVGDLTDVVGQAGPLPLLERAHPMTCRADSLQYISAQDVEDFESAYLLL